MLKIRAHETISWKGKFRPELINQSIYPRPIQNELPIWVGVGGTPESCIRAGTLGLPLMIAIIGGETHRFKRQVQLYKSAGEAANHPASQLKVGIHSLGYVAPTTEQALEEFSILATKKYSTKLAKNGLVTRHQRPFFNANWPIGCISCRQPQRCGRKIKRHSEALGGLSRFTFQMNVAALTHHQVMTSIELIGRKVMPLLKDIE